MTIVVSYISAKGGSGKTVVTVSTAKLLTELGFRVLMIDGDAATNGATLFMLEEILEQKENILENEPQGPLRGVFESIPSPPYPESYSSKHTAILTRFGFDLLPAAFDMRDTVKLAASQPDPLGDAIRWALEQGYEYVLVDNEAGIERTAVTSAGISNRVIIVSEFDPVSSRGVRRIQALHDDILPELHTWVLYNKVLPEFADSISNLATIRYLPPIAWNAEVVKSYALSEVDINLGSPTDFTLSVANYLRASFPTTVRERLDEWRKLSLDHYASVLKKQRTALHDDWERSKRSSTLLELYPVVSFTSFIVAVICLLVVTSNPIPRWLGILIVLIPTVVSLFGAWRWFLEWRRNFGQLPPDTLSPRIREIDLLLASYDESTTDFSRLRDWLQRAASAGQGK